MFQKKITKSLIAILLSATFLACESAPDATAPTSDNKNSLRLYAGEFIYGADAAIFIDCKTEKQYPVTGGAAYTTLERAYMDAEHEDFQPEWVQIEGYLEERTGNSDQKALFLIVDKFIGLEEGRLCE